MELTGQPAGEHFHERLVQEKRSELAQLLPSSFEEVGFETPHRVDVQLFELQSHLPITKVSKCLFFLLIRSPNHLALSSHHQKS